MPKDDEVVMESRYKIPIQDVVWIGARGAATKWGSDPHCAVEGGMEFEWRRALTPALARGEREKHLGDAFMAESPV